MIFLAAMYEPNKEWEYLEKNKGNLPNCSNIFQSNVIRGLTENNVEDLKIINVLPVGTWPNYYCELFLQERSWEYRGCKAYEVPCVNIPVLKQVQRARNVQRLLSTLAEDDNEILIYSTYLPFLKAVYRLKPEIKTTLIVTDLPEYYDLGRVSIIRRILRRINNWHIYKKLKRIDRFVLLTEQMKDALRVGNRPYTILEGMFSDNSGYDNCSNGSAEKSKEIIFYSGTLHYKFGIKTLLEAFKMIEDNEIELWICGAGEAETEIKENALTDQRIRYFGYITSEELRELRKAATVLVNPRPNSGEYTKYSFPSKTMEYMASGKPVVMYKLDGIPAEYDPYLMYIEGDSAEDMAMAFKKLFAMSADERTAFASTAREFVVGKKNTKSQVKRILDMI